MIVPSNYAANVEWDEFLKDRVSEWVLLNREGYEPSLFSYLRMSEAEYAAWQSHGFVYARVRQSWTGTVL
jgi:hypothetical protein